MSFNFVLSQVDSNYFRFYGGSAYTLKPHYFKYSLIEESEYGISKNLSIVGHPIMLFLSPSLSLKYNLFKKNNLSISSIHGFNYPTLLMNMVKTKGTGGFISPEFSIPHLFSIRNSIISTIAFEEKLFLNGSIGIDIALNNSKLEPGTSIDLPIILPRSMVYYKNIGFILNIGVEGSLSRNFQFQCESEIFIFPIEDDKYDYEYQETSNSFFAEISSNVFWNITNTFSLGAGTRLCFGNYPFGSQWHLLPFIDFVKYIE